MGQKIFESVFKIPIYDMKVKVVICEDFKLYCSKKMGINSYDKRATVWDQTDTEGSEHSFFLLMTFNDLAESLISHESNHIALRTLWTIGVKINKSSEEALTYLQAYVYDKIRVISITAKNYKLKSDEAKHKSKEIQKTTRGTNKVQKRQRSRKS